MTAEATSECKQTCPAGTKHTNKPVSWSYQPCQRGWVAILVQIACLGTTDSQLEKGRMVEETCFEFLTSKWLGLYKLNLVTAQWAKKRTQKEINPKPAGCGKISFQQASVGLPTPNGQATRSKHKQTHGAKSPNISIENYVCSLTTSLEHIASVGCDCISHKRMQTNISRKNKTHQQAFYMELSAMPKGLGGHFSANSAPRINGVSVRKWQYGKRNLPWAFDLKMTWVRLAEFGDSTMGQKDDPEGNKSSTCLLVKNFFSTGFYGFANAKRTSAPVDA